METRVNLWLVLPEEMIIKITTSSGLDLKSIIKCKLVCKPWRNLVSNNPHAAKGHVQLLAYDPYPPRFEAVDVETQETAPMMSLDSPSGPDPEGIVSSCNGLVCFLGRCSEDIYVCNPIVGEYVQIPNPNHEYAHSYRYDLGFCPSNNEYKLTLFTERTLEVYTLGSSRWRGVPFELPELRSPLEPAVCVGGVLHWLLETRRVLTFDLGKEVFGAIPLPHLEDRDKYQLECMDSGLVLVTARYRDSTLGLAIWERKEDKSSGESIWTKDWVIVSTLPLWLGDANQRAMFRKLLPSKLSIEGRVIMASYYMSQYHYNPRCHPLGRKPHTYYKATLISPKKLMRKIDGEDQKTEKKDLEISK